MARNDELFISIREMQTRDLDAVSLIHIEQFPNARSTALGRPYVRKMYRWFVDNQKGLVFVAAESGQITGFVTGAIGGYGRKIFRYAIFEILAGLVIYPWLLFRKNTFTLWSSYLKGLTPSYSPRNDKRYALARNDKRYALDGSRANKASLSSIAVCKEYRGKGIGKALLIAFEKGASQQGIKRLGLSVKEDNIAAQNLYKECGWVIEHKDSSLNTIYFIKNI